MVGTALLVGQGEGFVVGGGINSFSIVGTTLLVSHALHHVQQHFKHDHKLVFVVSFVRHTGPALSACSQFILILIFHV